MSRQPISLFTQGNSNELTINISSTLFPELKRGSWSLRVQSIAFARPPNQNQVYYLTSNICNTKCFNQRTHSADVRESAILFMCFHEHPIGPVSFNGHSALHCNNLQSVLQFQIRNVTNDRPNFELPNVSIICELCPSN